MRFTKEQYEAYKARRNRDRGGAKLQEQEEDRKENTVHKSESKAVDGQVLRGYSVSVTLRVADRRDRDGDGMYSTIQDCLIAAVGRLLGLDRIALRKLAKSEERRRGV